MRRRLFNVWVGGEFFGAILARNKTAVVLRVASIISTDIYPERLLVKPR
jgi:hypothetical protein